MKIKKILIGGLSILMAFGMGVSLATLKDGSNKVEVAEATSGYTTYYNDDLGFATRDEGDSRIVKGDSDGGQQTKGAALSEKSELILRYKKMQNDFWVGVGGYAVYVSGGTTVRFLYLTHQDSGPYNRNQEKSNLVLKTYDGSAALTDADSMGGNIFTQYCGVLMRVDFSNPSAVKVEFSVEYKGIRYYPFESSTRLDSVTYTHQAINFAAADQYRAMAGVNTQDSGITVLKFDNQKVDLSTVMSRGSRSFNYATIGDFKFTISLNAQISNYTGHLGDHLNEWYGKENTAVDIKNGLLINGKPLKYWVDFTDPYLTIDSTSVHGIHEFPVYVGGVFSPVDVNVTTSSMVFTFNTAFIPSDSIIITFKAGVFEGYYSGIIYSLANDLNFYATLKADDYGTPGSNVTFENSVTDTVNNYSITNVADNGEKTADNGAKYRKFTLWTNIPRDTTNINQGFPHDHYRYMFENIMFNGKTLQFYNVWGRGNNKDYTDLAAPTLNLDYELEHPAGILDINYNMVTYVCIATDQPNYVLFVDIPNKLMEDFGYDSYDFRLRDGSAWRTSSGVVRVNMSPSDKYAVTNFIDDNMHMSDVSTDNNTDTGDCRGESGYYLTAKKALNVLTDDQKDIFKTNTNTEEFVAARARYEAWAVACGDATPYDGNDYIAPASRNNGIAVALNENDNSSLIITIIISLTMTMSFATFLVLKKRKER